MNQPPWEVKVSPGFGRGFYLLRKSNLSAMQLLNDLVGRKVTVFSLQGATEKQDVGLLESTDGTWLKLKKSEAETLFLNVAHVRQVKPFDQH